VHNNVYICPICGFTKIIPKCAKCESDLTLKEQTAKNLKVLECKPCDIAYYDIGNGIPLTHEELFNKGVV
jgi:primosomal protein N'